ncbi:MAG: UxaA family hydrolase, partial [Sediminibacterium sp.]
MKQKVLKIHPADNVLVALADLRKGEAVAYNGEEHLLAEDVQAKHKFVLHDVPTGGDIKMYGLKVGEAVLPISKGSRISTSNTQHATGGDAVLRNGKTAWQHPDVSRWNDTTFMGYHRADGSVGVANYWLVIPLVFCETRNVMVLKEALLKVLGYDDALTEYNLHTQKLVQAHREGSSNDELLDLDIDLSDNDQRKTSRIFPNV